jgi:hypothetical protein
MHRLILVRSSFRILGIDHGNISQNRNLRKKYLIVFKIGEVYGVHCIRRTRTANPTPINIPITQATTTKMSIIQRNPQSALCVLIDLQRRNTGNKERKQRE